MWMIAGKNKTMRVYIIEVISKSDPTVRKISQEGFPTFESAQNWCRKKPEIKEELQNGWIFVSKDYEYRIHDVLVR